MHHASCSAQVSIASGANALLGLLLMASPWLYGGATRFPHLTINDGVTGALMVVCSAIRCIWPHRAPGFSVVNVVLGFWVILAPAFFDYSMNVTRLRLNILAGIAIMLLASWSVCARLIEKG